MRKLIVLGVLAIGCGDNDDDITGGAGDVPPMNEDGDGDGDPTTPRTWQATLSSLDPSLPISGSATVIAFEGDEGFMAQIGVRGDIPGSVRPWHVHIGRCASGGAIVGPADAYPPLMIGGDGTAALAANINIPLDTGAYHVNVHLSPDDLPTLIACGDLIRQ